MDALILIIEDNADLARTIKDYFEHEGCRVALADTGDGGLCSAIEELPDAVILDLLLPDRPGLEICRALRAHPTTREVPIVICSALNRTGERVAGLEAGADDYVAKPVGLRELSLRVRRCMRRARIAPSGLRVDPGARRVWVGAIEIVLDAAEFDLLWALVSERGTGLSCDELRARVWGRDAAMPPPAIRDAIAHLRGKLAGADASIEALPDDRYCFRGEAADA